MRNGSFSFKTTNQIGGFMENINYTLLYLLIVLSWTGIYIGVKVDGTKRTLLVTNIMFTIVLGAWSVLGFVLYLIKEFLE